MAIRISNGTDLNKAFEIKAKLALEETQKIVGEAIGDAIDQYYKEKASRGKAPPDTGAYERTYKFLNSLIYTQIVKSENTLLCKVVIDEAYLKYTFSGNLKLEYKSSGDWIIWSEALNALNGEQGILKLLKGNLQKYGVRV